MPVKKLSDTSSTMVAPKVYPVILSGGSGTRLWPKSRTLFPKQFHSLTSKDTLLQEALLRVNDNSLYGQPMVVCNEDHRFIVAEQAAALGIELQAVVLEPEGRNTAPAVAVATELIRRIDPEGIVLVLASDHHIGNAAAFTEAVRTGVPAAAAGNICTFGITPTCPETGYGYIKRTGKEIAPGVFKIDQFKEKPDLPTAKKYVADPSYAWNAGLFLFSAAAMLEELDTNEPGIVDACKAAIDNGIRDNIIPGANFIRLSRPHFAEAKSTSVDYAVMEKTKKSAVIPLDAAWTDVGSWPSLYQTCLDGPLATPEQKKDKNFTVGDVSLIDVKNCYINSDGPLVGAIGIENICVIASEDAVMVLPMDRSQDVGTLAKSLKADPKHTMLAQKHKSEYKPWGSHKVISDGKGFKVIQLTLNPGASTSLQKHYHRAMHQVALGRL